MNRTVRMMVIGCMSVPLLASAGGHVSVGIGIGGPAYYGGYYGGHGYYRGYYGGYYAPYYYGPGYYGPYYGPAYAYAPPPVIYTQPVPTVQQAPASSWYYCAESQTYYPYVRECPGGWQTVPASVVPPQAKADLPRAAAQVDAPSGKVVYRFGDLPFETNQAGLEAAADSTLQSLLVTARREPSRHITVEGHTDSNGTASYNLELSQRRAEAVKQYLIAHGIAAERITAIGKGEADPIAGNDTAEGRKLNRRVDVIVS